MDVEAREHSVKQGDIAQAEGLHLSPVHLDFRLFCQICAFESKCDKYEQIQKKNIVRKVLDELFQRVQRLLQKQRNQNRQNHTNEHGANNPNERVVLIELETAAVNQLVPEEAQVEQDVKQHIPADHEADQAS